MKKDILQDLSEWHEGFDALHKRLEKDILSLKDDIHIRDEMVNSLQMQLAELKRQEKYKEKFDDVSSQLEKEKERLHKLYHQFAKKENECKNLRSEIKSWQDWLDSKKEIFNQLFSAPPIKGSNDSSKTPTTSNVKKKRRFK